MDFPAENVRIEATENIFYPSTRDSNGHITENESGLEHEKRLLAERKGGKKRKSGKRKSGKRKSGKKSKRTRRTCRR